MNDTLKGNAAARKLDNLLDKERATTAELRALLTILADRHMMSVDGRYIGEYSTRVNAALGR